MPEVRHLVVEAEIFDNCSSWEQALLAFKAVAAGRHRSLCRKFDAVALATNVTLLTQLIIKMPKTPFEKIWDRSSPSTDETSKAQIETPEGNCEECQIHF